MCGQALFFQRWRALASLQSMWGGARKVRGSPTTTFGRRRFLWITAWLCQKFAQGYPQPHGFALPGSSHGPCTAPSRAGPSKKKPGVLCRTPGWQGGEWQRGLKQSLYDDRLQRLSPQFRAMPYLAGAGVGAGPGRPSPPRMPPWWSPCPWRPSPPRMPPMGWPRWAWASKVFCCSGVSVA